MKRNLLLLIIIIITIPVFGINNGRYGIVKASRLNLREKSSTMSNIKATLEYGNVVTIQSLNDDWANVTYNYGGDEYWGYLKTDYIEIIDNSFPKPGNMQATWIWKGSEPGATIGYLYLTKEKDGNYSYDLRIISEELRETGGTGIVIQNCGRIHYNPEMENISNLDNPDNEILYDAKKGLLYLDGFLWE